MAKRLLVSLFLGATLSLLSEGAFALPPANADRVDLRVPGGCPVPQPANCVTSMAEVNAWLATVRATNAPPVIIDVGAGDFGPFACLGDQNPGTLQDQYITLRGSGRSVTKVADHTSTGEAITLHYCDEVELQDLSLLADGSSGDGIWYRGPGDTHYTDIEVQAKRFAFNETDWNQYTGCPYPASAAVQQSWNSTWRDLATTGTSAYDTACTQSLFYGSEVLGLNTAIRTRYSGDARLYGSVVRTLVPSTFTGTAYGVSMTFGGIFHMHGGIIAVDASAREGLGNTSVVGIAGGPGFAHALDTAFLVKAAGTGSATRVSGAGVEAPLILAPGPEIPEAGGGGSGAYVSTKGQDLYVETDCCSDGNCDSGLGSEPHLMTYNPSCTTSGPWFNSVTGKCRGVPVAGSCP